MENYMLILKFKCMQKSFFFLSSNGSPLKNKEILQGLNSLENRCKTSLEFFQRAQQLIVSFGYVPYLK